MKNARVLPLKDWDKRKDLGREILLHLSRVNTEVCRMTTDLSPHRTEYPLHLLFVMP